MQLENNIKVISKAKNQDTASQCDAPAAMSEGRNNRFNQTLKTTQSQCVASILSQIVNPIHVGSSIGKREQRVLCVKTN